MQGETIFILLFVVATAVAIAVQRRAAKCALIVTARVRKPEASRGFMMRFELGLDEPNLQRTVRSALTIGTSYVVDGPAPLAPYMLMHNSGRALGVSAAIILLALSAFGFVKGHFTFVPRLKGALQTALVGSVAASVSYLVAKFIV